MSGGGQDRQFAELLFGPANWIKRRVETISCLETGETRRHVSVDFVVPPDYSVSDSPGDTVLVPLGLLVKRTLTRFDIRDGHGGVLSVLDTASNGRISAAAIRGLLEGQFDTLTEQQVHLVERVVQSPAGRSSAALTKFVMSLATLVPPAWDLNEPPKKLSPDELSKLAALAALADLGEMFALIVELPNSVVGRRTVVKYSFEDPESSRRRFRLRDLRRPVRVEIGQPLVPSSKSYHLEFRPPPGAHVHRLSIRSQDDSWKVHGSGITAHVHISNAGDVQQYEASATLKPNRRGLVNYALLSCLAVLTTVGAGTVFRQDALGLEVGRAGSAATVLLAVPAFLLALLARGPEHPLSSQVLMPARILIAVSSFALLVQAAIVALSPRSDVAFGLGLGLVSVQSVATYYSAKMWALSDGASTVLARSVRSSLRDLRSWLGRLK